MYNKRCVEAEKIEMILETIDVLTTKFMRNKLEVLDGKFFVTPDDEGDVAVIPYEVFSSMMVFYIQSFSLSGDLQGDMLTVANALKTQTERRLISMIDSMVTMANESIEGAN